MAEPTNEESSRRRPPTGPWGTLAPALIVLAIGVLLSWLAMRTVHTKHLERMDVEFRGLSGDRISAIQTELRSHVEAIETISNIIAHAGSPTTRQFAVYSEHYRLSRNAARLVTWFGPAINESDEYVASALRGAAARGRITALSGLWTPPGHSPTNVVAVACPVRPAGSGESPPLGYILGIISIADAVEAGLASLRPGGVDVYVEERQGGGDRALYVHVSRTRATRGQSDLLAGQKLGLFFDEEEFRFLNLSWHLYGRPAPKFVSARVTQQPRMAFAAGLATTGLALLFVVSNRRRTQQIVRLNETLENRVERRTRELAENNVRLREARDEAERANRAKSEFLSRMSHELRTPLNGILGFSQLLESSQLTDRQRKSVHRILKAGRHLLDLINEVLDIARVEAGRLKISLEPVRVAHAVNDALDLILPLARDRSVSIRVSPEADAALHVMADQQRLKQVLLNLCGNAVKYNREGGSVDIVWRESAPGRTRIEVHDTGIGISAEHRSRIFTPFDRLGAESTGIEGTGLGLAVARRFAEAMAGEVDFSSVPESGSTFWIELATVSIDDTSADADTRIEDAGPTASGTVLYVEDNPENLALVQEILEKRPNVRLLSAVQGRVGLTMAMDHQPDLIFLDQHLPDVLGDEILIRLRTDERTREIPVYILSADALPASIRRLRELGARDYIVKPLDVHQFIQIVDETLTRKTATP